MPTNPLTSMYVCTQVDGTDMTSYVDKYLFRTSHFSECTRVLSIICAVYFHFFLITLMVIIHRMIYDMIDVYVCFQCKSFMLLLHNHKKCIWAFRSFDFMTIQSSVLSFVCTHICMLCSQLQARRHTNDVFTFTHH
jgi:hypothetical protein